MRSTFQGYVQVGRRPEFRRFWLGMSRSTFDALAAGSSVNVELPLAARDALDGHLVQGYVDAVGKFVRVDEEGASWRVWIRPPERFRGQLTAKTPIAVNGVSMTVTEVLKNRFCVVVLPVTRTATTLVHLAQGTRVNLELDLVTRLVTLRGSSASAALGRMTAALPRAGHVAGCAGVAQAVRQFAAGGAVLVWDPAVEGEADVVLPRGPAQARVLHLPAQGGLRLSVRAVCGVRARPPGDGRALRGRRAPAGRRVL